MADSTEGLDDNYPTYGKVNSDLAIVKRLARRKDWEIPEEALTKAPGVLMGVLRSKDASNRDKIMASRALVAMRRDNEAAVSTELRVNQVLAVNVEAPPERPEDVSEEAEAFVEEVRPGDLQETVKVLEECGLMSKYIDQLKSQGRLPHHNGNGHTNGNGSK